MENWCFPEDRTAPVIDPERHIAAKYPPGQVPRLPEWAIVFFLGKGLPELERLYPTRVQLEELPGFITHSRVLGVAGEEGVCFLHGGYGAPQAACTMETLRVLGVRKTLLVGLCGGFGKETAVGDVFLPGRIWSEEGTSRHYFPEGGFAETDAPSGLEERLRYEGLRVRREPIVTTDAVYRQTFFKEAKWRDLGCAAVDMEASAAANVCRFRGMRCAAALMVSDRHPLAPDEPAWAWGSEDLPDRRERFLRACIEYALNEARGTDK